MKKFIYVLIIISIMSTVLTGCGKKVEVKNGSKVTVTLKDDKFTATEYYEKIKENNISVLIDMVDTSLFSKKYKTDKEEDEYVEKQIDQIKSMYGNENNDYTSIYKSYFGVETEDEVKDKLRLDYKRNLAVEDYIKNHISKGEINKYYKENIYGEIKASHILIAVKASDKDTNEEKTKKEKEAIEKVNNIIKELDEGKDFKELVKDNSNDKATATNGGDLGYFNPSDMPQDFFEAVKNLKVNEYTKTAVKTELGYHIILKTNEKAKPKLKEVKKDILEKIKTEKLENDKALYYKTLKNIRKDNKIKYNDDALKKAYNKYMDDLIENAKK